MTPQEMEGWREDFEGFHARFSHLFPRSEPREQAAKYMRGLVANVPRKNSWQVAEAVGDESPDRTERLLYRADWDEDEARDVLQEFVIETFGEEDAIGVVDETGFPKKGDKSVGVQRQYSGTVGKVENCQIATFLTYTSSGGYVFLDRRLYLPKEWAMDRERRRGAKVPEGIEFQTKSEQAIEMLGGAWSRGVPMRWVVGDEVYGDATRLRDFVTHHGRLYVLAVSSNTPVWAEKPALEGEPEGLADTGLRMREVPPPRTVADVVASWPVGKWRRLTVAEGEKGPRTYDWARDRVMESREALPGPDAWLLARRSVTNPSEIAYYLSNAPPGTPLLKLAQVASMRYTIEQSIQQAKGETGLDEYEVRHWHSWHRHITLSMMAQVWLSSIRRKAEKKGGFQTRSSPS